MRRVASAAARNAKDSITAVTATKLYGPSRCQLAWAVQPAPTTTQTVPKIRFWNTTPGGSDGRTRRPYTLSPEGVISGPPT
ncbi:hypothetical protein DIPPA_17763 [Diplonema papillatum]|nr:hypothetical protein DIPPA_17763 [Diplonema papillatum]